MQRCERVAALLSLAAMVMLCAGNAEAQSACTTETADLKALAQGVHVDVTAPTDLRSGGTMRVTWRAGSRFPAKMPAFAVVAIPGEVRVETPALPVQGDTSDPPPDLPGMLVLPPGAQGPLGIAFGAGKTRLLIPLHQHGNKPAGAVDVRVFEAGALALEADVIARTGCGERSLGRPFERNLTVAPGTAEIVVQDPFDIDVPQRILISNSGRYRLHEFKGSYRVFELATGAKLVDRAGHNPNFSPTSRFVVADVGDPDGRDFEVIDLVSQQVIHTVAGPFVGWANGDTFLIDGAFRAGSLTVRPSLITRPVPRADNPLEQVGDRLGLSAPGSCNACSSWTDSPMTLDLDNGIVVFPDTFSGGTGDVYELASGFKACCAPAGDDAIGKPAEGAEAKLRQFVSSAYGARPIEWKAGWNVRGGLAFSHLFDPLAKPDPRMADQNWYQAAIPMRGQLVQHRALDNQVQPARIAGLTEGVVLRGDWRQRNPRPRSTDAASARKSLLEELGRFGVLTAPPATRETIAFSNSQGSEDTKGRYDKENRQLEQMIERRTRAVEQRLVADVPAVKPHLTKYKQGELQAFPYDGDLTAGKLLLTHHMEGLWRWQPEGNPLWLLQLFTIEGSGAFGQGALFLFEGKRGTPGRIISLSKALEGFWEGQYGGSAQQTRIKAQLFYERMLVVAHVASHAIGVYDVKEARKVALLHGIPQADLLEDVLLSADARHVVQLNSDGQFFLHEIATGRVPLSGRYVDGEIVIYAPEGYYWASYEGAHFVQLRFPGLPGLYPFQQFAAVLNRPDLIQARLAGASGAAPPRLVPPPVLEARLVEGTAGDGRRLRVQARSSTELAHLRVYEDGLLVADRPLSGLQFEGEVTLPAATNARWVTALAIDKGGLVSSPQAVRLAPGSGSTARLHGVLVGVDTYSDPRLKLTYAKSDARRLAGALRSSVGPYYAAESLRLLLDGEAVPAAIAASLEQVVAAAEPQDTIIFSFAGHGMKSDDGHYYLTPSGYNADDPKGTALSWTQVAGILGRARSRVVVILDACHSGLSGAEGIGTNDDAVASLLSGARAPMLVLAASKGRQSSYEHKKWGGGAFTYALVEALQRNRQGADLDANGVIEVSELYRALRSIVARETQGQQTPWLARQDLIGDFAVF